MCKKVEEKKCCIGRVIAIVCAVLAVLGAIAVVYKVLAERTEKGCALCAKLKAKLCRGADDESADYAD